MNEADVKRRMIKEVKEAGGYARRIEDQYGVGILDTLIVPACYPVFLAEVKMIKGQTFGPTARQFIEMQRIENASPHYAIPVLVGYKEGEGFFIHRAAQAAKLGDCFHKPGASFLDSLKGWYNER